MSSEVWKKWEGQVVDHKYQLLRYLGATDHSVVFLAEFHDPEPRQAAIKFISAEFGNREEQIAAWKEASKLSHPNLIRIYGGGLCKIEDTDLLYVAMEYAEENLAQVLPSRALMAEETSEMLNSVVDVLVYLHGKNVVHGHVKPSNILANGESLKLSSDTIFPAGEVREMRRERSAYDGPELPRAGYTPASDVWSLGVTLVESLTQQHAVLPFNEQADPIIPAAVREPYLEISRHALRREPKLRWTSARIAERLNPTAATARSVAAGAGVSALSGVASVSTAARATAVAPPAPPVTAPKRVLLSNEVAREASPARVPPTARKTPVSEQGVARRETMVLPNYVIPMFAGLLLLIALILLPFVLHHKAAPVPSTVVSSSAAPNPARAIAPDPGSSATSAVNNPPVASNLPPAKTANEPPAPSVARPQPVIPSPAPTVSRNEESIRTPTVKASSPSPGKGEVLDQAKPEASAKALATIHGTVRVGVKVHVDAAGNVSDATLENVGPSRYFADLSLKAARQWVFTAPEADGRSVPSDWKIQFHYTQSGVEMSSQQVAP
jgi:serine/threonine protein kinase